MRHVWTLIAAAVIAPLAWILLAFGQDRSIQAFANARSDGGFDAGDFVRPALCLAAAGLVLGLIATLRLSPLGAAFTGVAYSASYLALLVDPDGVLDLFPENLSLAGRDADPTTPLRTGTALLLGALLLVGIGSVGRWRRWPARDAYEPDRFDDSAPLVHAGDRPLGADGLGLTTPARVPEPDLPYEPSRAGGYEWPAESRRGTESEFVTRYPTRAESSANSTGHWPGEGRRDYEAAQRVRRPFG